MSSSLADMSPVERFDALPRFLAEHPSEGLRRLCPLSALVPDAPQPFMDSQTDETRFMSEIVAALHCFDCGFEHILGYRSHIYLLGDAGVKTLLKIGQAHTQPSTEKLSIYLEALATLGLIYRFNVARKFGYSERGLSQLRLNSWGRRLAKLHKLKITPSFMRASQTLTAMLRENESPYIQVVQLCNAAERPLDTDVIHSFNVQLPIKVVT